MPGCKSKAQNGMRNPQGIELYVVLGDFQSREKKRATSVHDRGKPWKQA